MNSQDVASRGQKSPRIIPQNGVILAQVASPLELKWGRRLGDPIDWPCNYYCLVQLKLRTSRKVSFPNATIETFLRFHGKENLESETREGFQLPRVRPNFGVILGKSISALAGRIEILFRAANLNCLRFVSTSRP